MSTTTLCGDDWQIWANKLLTCRYGPTDYQKVADNHQGDAGIEGFSISDGVAYQAYGPEGEPLTTKARYEKHRIKMTVDVGKFINNMDILHSLFGTVTINRWALFVPISDSKDLITHATKKTAEVVAAKLPYVTSVFRVVVCAEEDFVVERDQLVNAGAKTLTFAPPPTTGQQVTAWAGSNTDLTTSLEEKLERLETLRTPAKRIAFRDEILKWYLQGQALLDQLRTYPETYERVLRTKAHHENFLAMASAGTQSGSSILVHCLATLESALKAEVRELHTFNVDALRYEAIADWLLRCPLDFPA